MKTKPILFSTEMVQAINEGRKTQTRRTIKPIPFESEYGKLNFKGRELTLNSLVNHATVSKGDILWVRETFEKVKVQNAPVNSTDWLSINKYKYKADTSESFIKWKPSIFMPKEACRIWLEVKNVRVERLKDISENDAIAEGVEHYWNGLFQEERYKDYSKAKPGRFKPQRFYKEENNTLGEWREANSSFFSLWESINGKSSLDANPWVWVYEFERCEMPKKFLS